MRAFVDTNLWVYCFDQREPDKSRWIKEWLRKLAADSEIVVSTQVLIELRSVLTRKLKPPVSAEAAHGVLLSVARFEVVSTDSPLVLDAHVLAQREQLGWFDALIVEAAIRSGCDVLYSEDLAHHRKCSGLIIRNPFLDEEFKTHTLDP